MKVIFIAIVLFFAGCTVTQPYVTAYRITPNVKQKEYRATSCKHKSLKIGQLFSSNSLMSRDMRYVEGRFKEFTFTQSQWASNPNKAISAQLVKSIRDTKLFANVSSYKSRSRADLLLETNVEKFMQYFTQESKKSYVKVVLNLNLLDVQSGKSIANITVEKKLDEMNADAQSGVIALNRGLGDTLFQTNEWLASVCK